MTTELEVHEANDEQARHHIAEMLDKSLFVEAGAGTGKTRALVDRFVALVAAGRRVEELVAITFTEKAAAELRDRVRAELEHRIDAGIGDTALLIRAREGLDRAQISTIHAFCGNVLRSFAAQSGIDPSFAVQDEVASERRFEVEWVSFLEHKSDVPAAHEAFSRVLELGLYTRDLEKLAHELWSNPALAERLAERPLPKTPASWPDLNELERKLADLHLERVVQGDALREYGYLVEDILQSLGAVEGSDRDARLLGRWPELRLKLGTTGNKGNWSAGVDTTTARDVLIEIGQSLIDCLASLRTEALGDFMPFVVDFASADTVKRGRAGLLVFDDLILRVRNILQADPEARRQLRTRYSALLIDEFQDTDPSQTEIALAFAVDPDTGVFDGGRLFLVGDPKQSIYRFRRADMVIYSQTRETLRDNNGKEEFLALNRRSRAEVLDFVNGVFARLIGDGADPRVQPAYGPVHPFRRASLRGPGVGWFGGSHPGAARDMRIAETQQIAAYCRQIVEEPWQVQKRGSSEIVDARYGDVAILLPTRTSLGPLERALTEAGVPYRVEGGSLVYATQEVRDLINCLAAIDDPTDEVAVVGALRSPAYACSDVDLAEHKLGKGYFDYLDYRLEPTSKVREALLHLRSFHELRGQVSIAALVERFIAGQRMVEAGLYTSGTRDAFRRARFIIEQGRLFEAEQPESLRAFVEWLSRRQDDAILDYEGAGLDDDEDAVRILTVHAAKGLEFPVVILGGLGVAPSAVGSTYMVDRTTDEVAVSIGSDNRNNKSTLGSYTDVKTREEAHAAAERVRLLYVAATRARDHLVLSLYHSVGRSHAGFLISKGDVQNLAVGLPELPAVTGASTGPFAGLTVDAEPRTEEAFSLARSVLVAASVGQRITSATGLAKLDKGTDDEEKEREDETEPWARGRAGTHRGRAVHAALQVLPWDADDETLVALASAQAVVETIPGLDSEVADLLRKALATDAAGRARVARRALREVPFAFEAEGVLLEGFIDLVIEGGDGSLEVVDWKTDALPASQVQTRLEQYRLQAGLYVLGMEAATGRTVSRVTYVFVAPGEEVSPGEPASLAEAARERILSFARAGS